jgi:hypothetical protein
MASATVSMTCDYQSGWPVEPVGPLEQNGKRYLVTGKRETGSTYILNI